MEQKCGSGGLSRLWIAEPALGSPWSALRRKAAGWGGGRRGWTGQVLVDTSFLRPANERKKERSQGTRPKFVSGKSWGEEESAAGPQEGRWRADCRDARWARRVGGGVLPLPLAFPSPSSPQHPADTGPRPTQSIYRESLPRQRAQQNLLLGEAGAFSQRLPAGRPPGAQSLGKEQKGEPAGG